MSGNALKSSELKEFQFQLSQLVTSSNKRRRELRANNKITPAEDLEISRCLTKLNGSYNIRAIEQIHEILTDLQGPGDKIKKVTGKLEAAIKKVEKGNTFVKILTSLTNLVGAILSPASGGLAKIAAVVNELDNFDIG